MTTAGNGKTQTTLERILASSLQLFSERWYSSVSIAEICRAAGVSNGIFYRYFPNKEALIKRILDETIQEIAQALAAVAGVSVRERLESMADILLGFSAGHPDVVTVFREGQYRYFEYERRLTDRYRRTLSQTLGRTVGMHEYLFAMGGIRFASVRSALHGSAVSAESLHHILREGAFPGLDFNEIKVFDISVQPPVLELDEGSRERMLRAGKKLFGEKDYHEVNIHEITDAAGLAVGSFYKYFDGKETFFCELIDSAGREIRRFIARNMSQGLNRLERELQGIYLFGVFLSLDRWCYNIVREGEFVAPGRVRDYYAAFERGYERLGGEGLSPERAASSSYRSTLIEFLLGIAHYYGIELLFDGFPRGARSVLCSLGRLLSDGVETEQEQH